MHNKKAKIRLSIKIKIIGILIITLLLSFIGHVCILFYSSDRVINIAQQAITNIYNYENKINVDLKNNILKKIVTEEVKIYADFLNNEAMNYKQNPDLPFKNSKLIKDKATGGNLFYPLDILKILGINNERPGYMYILNNKGIIVEVEGAHPNPVYEKNFKLNDDVFLSENKVLADISKNLIDSKLTYGVFNISLDNEEFFLLFSKINSLDSFLVKILPENYYNQQVDLIAEKINKYINSIRTNIVSLDREINYISLVVFFGIIIFVFIIGSFLSNAISRPLIRLKKATKLIGGGNLINKIKISTGDEIEELADNFNLMTKNLKDYINKLSISMSKRRAIEADIKLAANIQTSCLPNNDELRLKQLSGIDLFSYLNPSKIVSGDFYDFFFIDDTKLFIALGDVSGKSISAALYMMTTKLLMKRFALMKQKPDEILKNVNDTLALDNKTCMYSTIFCGILNTESGNMHFCNAGHTPPIIFDGISTKYLDTKENMLVGLTPKAEFESQIVKMQNNGALLMYSDGVTEAKNMNNELYTEERLLEKMLMIPKESAKCVIDGINKDLQEFSGNAEQYDDITMLCIKYKSMREIKF